MGWVRDEGAEGEHGKTPHNGLRSNTFWRLRVPSERFVLVRVKTKLIIRSERIGYNNTIHVMIILHALESCILHVRGISRCDAHVYTRNARHLNAVGLNLFRTISVAVHHNTLCRVYVVINYNNIMHLEYPCMRRAKYKASFEPKC